MPDKYKFSIGSVNGVYRIDNVVKSNENKFAKKITMTCLECGKTITCSRQACYLYFSYNGCRCRRKDRELNTENSKKRESRLCKSFQCPKPERPEDTELYTYTLHNNKGDLSYRKYPNKGIIKRVQDILDVSYQVATKVYHSAVYTGIKTLSELESFLRNIMYGKSNKKEDVIRQDSPCGKKNIRVSIPSKKGSNEYVTYCNELYSIYRKDGVEKRRLNKQAVCKINSSLNLGLKRVKNLLYYAIRNGHCTADSVIEFYRDKHIRSKTRRNTQFDTDAVKGSVGTSIGTWLVLDYKSIITVRGYTCSCLELVCTECGRSISVNANTFLSGRIQQCQHLPSRTQKFNTCHYGDIEEFRPSGELEEGYYVRKEEALFSSLSIKEFPVDASKYLSNFQIMSTDPELLESYVDAKLKGSIDLVDKFSYMYSCQDCVPLSAKASAILWGREHPKHKTVWYNEDGKKRIRGFRTWKHGKRGKKKGIVHT